MMLRAWLALATTGPATRLYMSAAKEALGTNYARDRVIDVFGKIAALCEDVDPAVRGEAFAAIDRALGARVCARVVGCAWPRLVGCSERSALTQARRVVRLCPCPPTRTYAAVFAELESSSAQRRLDQFAPAEAAALDGSAAAVAVDLSSATTTPGLGGRPGEQAGRDAVLELVRAVTRAMCPRFVALTAAVSGLNITQQHTGVRVLTRLADHVLKAPEGLFGTEATVCWACGARTAG